MFAKRRVHGESRAGEYSFGPEHSQPPARQESGPVSKRPVPRLTGRQSARLAVLVDSLRRSLAGRRYSAALAQLSELLMLEPDEPRWHQKHGDVLRVLDREQDAAAAFRRAAQRYELQGLSVHASALLRVADMLDGAKPAGGSVTRLSDLRPTQSVKRPEDAITVRPPSA